MTAPVLAHKKFYIIKPYGGYNYIKNPAFSPPDFEHDWTAGGAGVTIESTGDEQRRGAYSMKVNTANGVLCQAYYSNTLSVTSGLTYTFSVDVKAAAGMPMVIHITNAAQQSKAQVNWIATGYWQRKEVTLLATETASDYRVFVNRTAYASTDPYYVDGAQFEQALAASTFIEGNQPGCGWVGYARNSASWRDPHYGLGGLIVDLEDYCHVVQVTGLGHGDWNQILTKMTNGGDMYQTHIRKSRQFSIIVDFIGNSLGEIESNRAAVIDLLRPDRLRGQEMVVRYQGVDVNGVEATNPVDIVCVPLPKTLPDTPDLPTYQRDVLNFSIPSGLLNGAYNEGKELNLYADFPAEFIVKRDPQGNWCKYNSGTGDYDSLITGLNGSVACITEGPDGKIYVCGNFTDAGGTTEADSVARWNPVTELWEAVGNPNVGGINTMAFDASGDLLVGGASLNIAGVPEADYFAKYTLGTGSSAAWEAVGSGIFTAMSTNKGVRAIAVSPDGHIYIGGTFESASNDTDCNNIALWNSTTKLWTPLSTGLNKTVNALAFAPNGDLYIGGSFTDTNYPYLCKWNGTAFSAVGSSTDINGAVNALAFDHVGRLWIGGAFTNAGGNANADYIARWNGSQWEALGSGVNSSVHAIAIANPVQTRDGNGGRMTVEKVYVTGAFTSAGKITTADKLAVYSSGAWKPLNINLPGNSLVVPYPRATAILPASDGSLYIGGTFSTAGEDPDENAETEIAALNLNLTSASANTYPYMQITGPGTLRAITNYSTGKSVMFDGLTLNAGEAISLKFDPLDLQFKGDWAGRGNLMRYVVPGSDYGDFYLMPGENHLSLFMGDPDEVTAASGAWIAWTPLFWGLDGAVLE